MCVQYHRILLSILREEDYLLAIICVGGTTI